ncbi:unnamed protein product [Linum trigynum]|uniref:Uncharacterized protein n=1 Tax=Linum trigynum TaxID=586398 RepID=A0AAV2E323_9ROSI
MQAEWLLSVRETAERRNWTFPPSYVMRSKYRVIHVGKAWNRRGFFLKVAESIYADRSFYVIIPSDSDVGDWRSLIKLLRQLLHSRPDCNASPHLVVDEPRRVSSRLSFAYAVRGDAFRTDGEAKICLEGQSKYINVGSSGVNERSSFLKKCLSISFSNPSKEAFHHDQVKAFRSWASRKWAVAENFDMVCCETNKWSMVCASREEAIRIKNLGSTHFQNFRVLPQLLQTMYVHVRNVGCMVEMVLGVKSLPFEFWVANCNQPINKSEP